jgi:hypothetical protein
VRGAGSLVLGGVDGRRPAPRERARAGRGPAGRDGGAGRTARRLTLGLAVLLALAPTAHGFDFFDGRIQIHGYASTQVRFLSQGFHPSSGYDLSQWYNILNVELEANVLPNGWGPLETLDFYGRVEGRYDCVWTHACHLFGSVDAYGDQAHHLPEYSVNGRRTGVSGSLLTDDTQKYTNLDRENYELWQRIYHVDHSTRPLKFEQLPGIVSLFGNSTGVNRVFEPIGPYYGDDPAPFMFERTLNDCIFGVKQVNGGENGQQTNILGPWNPGCHIKANGATRGLPNPFSYLDFNPVLAGLDRIPGTPDDPKNPNGFNPSPTVVPYGEGALPYRPAPFYPSTDQHAPRNEAQGLYYPSPGLVHALEHDHLGSIEQNFSQNDLAWNHGYSQQETYELKEAYFDMEAAEGRLWLRIGKQTVVWGKTELFRNTDQFNPQDLALSSLPGLEESRIALWSARGTWSFYNVGPLEDLRLELAFNFDHYQPADLGRCGEPYALDVVCGITFGYYAHGLTGAGLAGVQDPPDPWKNLDGLESGARVEFRYGRFSFQISDFYGYDDFPYPKRISTYERNVDPTSGMPRRAGASGPCTTGDSTIQPSCLGRPDAVALDASGQPLRMRDWNKDGIPDDVNNDGTPDILSRTSPGLLGIYYKTGELIVDPAFRADVLANNPQNQTVYALANAGACGAAGIDVDPALCGFTSFNGKEGPAPTISTVAEGASGLLAGSNSAFQSGKNNHFLPNVPTMNLATLHQQPGDNVGVFSDGGAGPFAAINQGLGQYLTPQQEALLGCGPFYHTDCDDDGVDFLNAEGSVMIQSWPGIDGTPGTVDTFRTDVGPQPGTIAFAQQYGSGPVATRYENGSYYEIPGSRGYIGTNGQPDPYYDPAVDGCTEPVPASVPDASLCAGANVVQPLTGQTFRTELGAVSWNLLMTLTARTDPYDPTYPAMSEFDASDPNGYGLINSGPHAGEPRKGLTMAQVQQAVATGTPIACGFLKPQLCQNVLGFMASLGVERKTVHAGGNGSYGRRDFAWDQSGEVVLSYQKRNVLGFAFDFDEDRTKTNWGVEATWVSGQRFVDNADPNGERKSDTFNLTVSADRPTFINFLNANRTFLFNTQWFFQYVDQYKNGFTTNGPVNVLATFTIFTGYHQDRLLLFYTSVYDFMSNSGAFLPQVIYRFTENFSATVGLNYFWGRQQWVDSPVNDLHAGLDRTGSHAYQDSVQNGLSVLSNRDEVYMTIRYTF